MTRRMSNLLLLFLRVISMGNILWIGILCKIGVRYLTKCFKLFENIYFFVLNNFNYTETDFWVLGHNSV